MGGVSGVGLSAALNYTWLALGPKGLSINRESLECSLLKPHPPPTTSGSQRYMEQSQQTQLYAIYFSPMQGEFPPRSLSQLPVPFLLPEWAQSTFSLY